MKIVSRREKKLKDSFVYGDESLYLSDNNEIVDKNGLMVSDDVLKEYFSIMGSTNDHKNRATLHISMYGDPGTYKRLLTYDAEANRFYSTFTKDEILTYTNKTISEMIWAPNVTSHKFMVGEHLVLVSESACRDYRLYTVGGQNFLYKKKPLIYEAESSASINYFLESLVDPLPSKKYELIEFESHDHTVEKYIAEIAGNQSDYNIFLHNKEDFVEIRFGTRGHTEEVVEFLLDRSTLELTRSEYDEDGELKSVKKVSLDSSYDDSYTDRLIDIHSNELANPYIHAASKIESAKNYYKKIKVRKKISKKDELTDKSKDGERMKDEKRTGDSRTSQVWEGAKYGFSKGIVNRSSDLVSRSIVDGMGVGESEALKKAFRFVLQSGSAELIGFVPDSACEKVRISPSTKEDSASFLRKTAGENLGRSLVDVASVLLPFFKNTLSEFTASDIDSVAEEYVGTHTVVAEYEDECTVPDMDTEEEFGEEEFVEEEQFEYVK